MVVSVRRSFTAIVVAALSAFLASPGFAADKLEYNRTIRPILAENCFACHGPDSAARKGDLRIDQREPAIKSKAIVPGEVEGSELISRILSTNPEEQMPPPATHKTLTPTQKDLLRRWIAAGAVYEPHWSYTPVQRPSLPPVADAQWTRNAIDTFILARLEDSKIAPAPPADRRTLLRRLALDLTGLPPTPAEVEKFVRDHSAQAYGKQVERLLASPHYGERMAAPWLDAVRFADTVGYHGDQNQNIFPYRDYVIDAFNRNEPFDQFTIAQIAGDLLPDATEEQQIATGFNRLNMMTREGGAQPKEYLAKYAADRVRTVSTVWLGSTMACCECHDHKFDPFTTRDFYSLAAFFDDVKQWGVYQDYGYTPNPELAGWSNDHPFPPERFVTNQFLLRREARLNVERGQFVESEMAEVLASKPGRESFEWWQTQIREWLQTSPDGWRGELQPAVQLANPNATATVAVLADGSILRTGQTVKSDKLRVDVPLATGWVSAIRLELRPHPDLNYSSLRLGNAGTEIRLTAEVKPADGRSTKLPFYFADATSKRPVYENGYEVPGVSRSWKLDAAAATNQQSAVYLLDPPLAAAVGDVLQVTIESDALGCFRIATSPLANPTACGSGATPEFIRALECAPGRRTREQKQMVAAAWLQGTTNRATAFGQLKDLNRELRECRHGLAPTLVTVTTTNALVTRVLPRGNWQDESGAIVAPAVPHFLPQPPGAGTNHLTRLDLARWLVARDNPLTARAFVNRLWKQFFGNGLSNQPEELGAQGEPPTHPELLDWLAAEFMDSGWDVKQVVRLIVTSATYQQDATGRPELRDADPNNRWLARQNPRRLEAELVRDNALSIAGLLNPEIGGPSVFPYQPADYYANLQFPNREYRASPDARQYRRGLYSHWQRTFLHPMLANFDAPAREECSVDRPVSTTPQQALTLLNDPTFVEAARVFAEKLLHTPKVKNDAARVNLAIETALLRPARPKEIESLLEFLATQRSYYVANESEARKLLQVGRQPPAADLPPAEYAAWTSLTRVVLNLHETITRY